MSNQRILNLITGACEGKIEDRANAIGELATFQEASVSRLLYDLLNDPNSYIQEQAGYALAKFPSTATIEQLLNRFDAIVQQGARTHYEGRVIGAIVTALQTITREDYGFDVARWREWAEGATGRSFNP